MPNQLRERSQVVIISDDPALFEAPAYLAWPDLDGLEFGRMGGEVVLAFNEQRDHVDERCHLGRCVPDPWHPGDREADLVVGLQRRYWPLKLQPAVTAETCPQGDTRDLRHERARVETVVPVESRFDVLKDRPRIRLTSNLVRKMALVDRVKSRAAGQVSPLVHDLEESRLSFARLRCKRVHWPGIISSASVDIPSRRGDGTTTNAIEQGDNPSLRQPARILRSPCHEAMTRVGASGQSYAAKGLSI
jgi:hypothetical protein